MCTLPRGRILTEHLPYAEGILTDQTNLSMGCNTSSESKESKRLQLAIANSKLIRIKIFSPAPGYEIEIHELENVLALLEKFALLLGLNKSAARSLQLEFSETTLAHELQLEPAGLCDESLCSVLGADGSVLNVDSVVKVNAVDILTAARQNQVAEVRLVCQYAPEKVNDKDSVMLLMYMLRLILLGLWDRMVPQLFTLLPIATFWRWPSCFWELELQLMPKTL